MGDYDRKPKESSGIFLRLKSKKESCRVRIVAAPLREPKVWIEGEREPMKAEDVTKLTAGQWATVMRKPDYRVAEVFHFLVIDRADGTAKIFTTTGGVYGKIRDFATNDEWGDPKQYDLTITRTEQPGKNYYDVVPSPAKSAPSSAELGLIDKLDIAKFLPAARLASEPQADDIDDNTEPEPLAGLPDENGEVVHSVGTPPPDWGGEPIDPPEDMPPFHDDEQTEQ